MKKTNQQTEKIHFFNGLAHSARKGVLFMAMLLLAGAGYGQNKLELIDCGCRDGVEEVYSVPDINPVNNIVDYHEFTILRCPNNGEVQLKSYKFISYSGAVTMGWINTEGAFMGLFDQSGIQLLKMPSNCVRWKVKSKTIGPGYGCLTGTNMVYITYETVLCNIDEEIECCIMDREMAARASQYSMSEIPKSECIGKYEEGFQCRKLCGYID